MATLAERVAVLERDLVALHADLGAVRMTVNDMATKDAIADAVSSRIKADRDERWSWVSRPVKITGAVLGIAVSICAVAGFAIQVWP